MSFVTEHIDIDTEHRDEDDGGISIGPARTFSRPLGMAFLPAHRNNTD